MSAASGARLLSRRTGNAAVIRTGGGDVCIPHTIFPNNMILWSGNFPRTFPSKNESRRGGNPNGLLASIRSKLMRPDLTVSIVQQKSRIESPQSTILSGQFALGGVL